jgi:hypothetical protein
MRRHTSRDLDAIGAHQLHLLFGFGRHVEGAMNVVLSEASELESYTSQSMARCVSGKVIENKCE